MNDAGENDIYVRGEVKTSRRLFQVERLKNDIQAQSTNIRSTGNFLMLRKSTSSSYAAAFRR